MSGKKIFFILFLSVLVQSACREAEWLPQEESAFVTTDCVPVEIAFSPEALPDTRSGAQGTLEENRIDNLLYAVFQRRVSRVCEKVNLLGQGYEAGGNKHTYTIQNIRKKWLDKDTELYAIANAPDSLAALLLKGECNIPDTLPLLQQAVEERMDSLARAYVYDLLVAAQCEGNLYPKDGKLYHAADQEAGYEEKKLQLPPECLFHTYAELLQKMNEPNVSVEHYQLYSTICTDLECRRVLFREADFNTKLEELKREEEVNHTVRKSLQADRNFQKYVLWSGCMYEKDLNAEAASNLSQRVDKAVMAGYLALSADFPSVIVLPLERIYSRIWFHFTWHALQEADYITIDSVVVNDLQQRTQMFNRSYHHADNNPVRPLPARHFIRNKEAKTQPFLGDLKKTAYPYHLGNSPELYFEAANSGAYPTVCRYVRTADGQVNSTVPPSVYYVYSYQWGGNELKDDPEIKVYYHFRKKTAAGQGNGGTLIYKRAVARLYDETHYPGKRHHGLLRNYTYRLNCQVTTLTNEMHLQVVAVPWYQAVVEDIPPFE